MTDKKISFGRVFWPSLTASIIILIIITIVFAFFIGSLMNSKSVYNVESNTILHMQLDGAIKEKSTAKINPLSFKIDQTMGLSELLYGFKKAAQDTKIKGVFIELKGAQCGYATATEIRNAINRFEEETDKFVVAYHSGEIISLNQYYIASAANESYGFHSSMFEFLGLGTELMFYKGLFDKIDLEMQVVRGNNNDFKSAVEPYFRKKMSDSSRLQMETYLNNIWDDVKKNISADIDVPASELDLIADSSRIRRVSQAVKYDLIDSVKYRDEVIKILAKKIGVENVKDLQFKGFEKYARKKFENQQAIANGKKANIAIVIAEGAVSVDGDGMASKRITKLLQEARKDDDIKTIVFRVNSPGGSALASEEIWREVKLANEKKKVIVSMGDVAASGGYYISTPSSKIFAESTTITGSIGVFGVIPYTGAMLENNLGITFDEVSTNQHAILSTNRKLSPSEFNTIQKEVNYIYEEFLNRVSKGRNLPLDRVKQIARGRVWTGGDALRVGLVDTLGGITDAIAYAAEQAKIEDPIVRYYPKVEKDVWMELIESFEEKDNVKVNALPKEFYALYERIKKVENFTGIQARLPYDFIWK